MSEQKTTPPGEYELKVGLINEIIGKVEEILRSNDSAAVVRWDRLTMDQQLELELDPDMRDMREMGYGFVHEMYKESRPTPEGRAELQNYESAEFAMSEVSSGETGEPQIVYFTITLKLDAQHTCRFTHVVYLDDYTICTHVLTLDSYGTISAGKKLVAREDEIRDTILRSGNIRLQLLAARITEGVASEAEVQDSMVELRQSWMQTMNEQEVYNLVDGVLDLYYRAKETLEMRRGAMDMSFQELVELRDKLFEQHQN